VGWGPFPNGGWWQEVDLKIQLNVYLPKAQRFDADDLMSLMGALSRNEIPTYQEIEA